MTMIKKISLLFTIFTICLFSVQAKKTKKIRKVSFYSKIFGHIHKSPSKYSQSLSTIACGHPVKVLSLNGREEWGKGFYFVQAGPYEGYIHREYLSDKGPECVQDQYPRFFDKLNLSISDMYYWGKLYDQYARGRSKVR